MDDYFLPSDSFTAVIGEDGKPDYESPDRIDRKHLLTLEAAISTYQTDEMQDKHLQLVVPQQIHCTYTENQRQWLYSVADFLDEIKEKQRKTPYAAMLRL